MRSSKIKKINVIITEFLNSSKKMDSNQYEPYKIWSKVLGETIRNQTRWKLKKVQLESCTPNQ